MTAIYQLLLEMSKKKSKRTQEKKTYLNTKPSEPVVKTFTHEQLLAALYFILDHFSRSNTPFFLTGDTARAVKDSRLLSGNKITVGIRKLDFQDRMMGILEAFKTADEIGDKSIKYTYNDVPIEVQVIDDSSDLFTSLNQVMYQHDFFKLPNPFEKYWANRNIY